MSARIARRVLAAALVLVVLAVVIYCAAWQTTGNHWSVVATPSMGTWAPVGTLLWITPVAFHSIKVGQVIAFHPPTAPGQTYTHRVVAINADGTLSTKGDINGTADAWRLHAHDVIGTVAHRMWHLGWVVKAAPVLIIGAILLWALTRWFCRPEWRLPARITGTAAVISAAIYFVKPLVRAELLSLSVVKGGGRAQIVGTGILPIKLTGNDGSHVVLREGQVGQIIVRHTDARHLYTVHVGAHIPMLWWIVAAVVLFLPPLYGLVRGFKPIEPSSA